MSRLPFGDAGEREHALVGARIKLEGFGEPAPSNMSVAGEGQIVLARVEPDPNVARGYWLWGAADMENTENTEDTENRENTENTEATEIQRCSAGRVGVSGADP